MPIVRKVIIVGNSKAITIPSSWLALIEKQTGQTVREIAVEVDGSLTISPILERKQVEAPP